MDKLLIAYTSSNTKLYICGPTDEIIYSIFDDLLGTVNAIDNMKTVVIIIAECSNINQIFIAIQNVYTDADINNIILYETL